MNRWRSLGLVVVLAVSLTAGAGAAGAAGAAAQGAGAAGPLDGTSITLITGDTLRYAVGADGRSTVDIVHAVSTVFRTQRTSHGTYVFPNTADPYLASGVLDRELFNVAYLAENGYGDGVSPTVPVIVDYAGRTAVRARIAAARPGRVLESINATAVTVDKANSSAFWRSLTGGAQLRSAGIEKVWLDRRVRLSLDQSVPQIGAPEAWAAGYDGTGVTVAVLDTGIDPTHPDVAGTVVGERDFSGKGSTVDGHGHGTHVAATIAGHGQRKGVAPGASLLIGKVLDDSGSALSSTVIEGMEWAATEAGADIVSLSLGSQSASDGLDPSSAAVNELTASTGTLFVIAAGNQGPGVVDSPGAADKALTVGAVDKQDRLASFSGTGPLVGTYHVKPNITAPGVGIVAARAAGTSMGSPVDDRYTSANGTSMATPHVAGAAAILLQRHPGWSPDAVRAGLTGTAKDGGYTAWEQGAGRVDVARAVRQRLRVDTATVSAGVLTAEDPATVRTLTFTNESTVDTTLSVAGTLHGADGAPAPAGMLSLDRAEVAVPAGGIATVTVTLNHKAGAVGTYHGAIVATTGAGDTLRVPVGVFSMPNRSRLTLRMIRPQGAVGFGIGPFWQVFRVDDRELPWTEPVTWRETADPAVLESTVLVPHGVFSASGNVQWVRETGPQVIHTADIVEPQITVDGDTTATIDLRKLVPHTVTTDRPVDLAYDSYGYVRTTETGGGFAAVTLTVLPKFYRLYRYPTPAVTLGTLSVKDTRILTEPEALLRLRSGDRRLTIVPSYPIYASRGVNDFVKFTRDATLELATEADVAAGRARGKLVYLNVPGTVENPDDWRQCIGSEERSWVCSVGVRTYEAARAGAAGVLLGTGRVGLDYLTFLSEQQYAVMRPIPLLWLDADQEAGVVDLLGNRRPVQVDLTARLIPDYEYRLVFREGGRVPASASYRLRDRDLKRIDTAYHDDLGLDPRFNKGRAALHTFGPEEFFSIAFENTFLTPARRAEFYTVNPDLLWAIHYGHQFNRFGESWRSITDTRGESTTWGRTPLTPGQWRPGPMAADRPLISCAVCRQGDTLYVRPRLTEGDPRHGYGLVVGQSSVTRLTRDGVEIAPTVGRTGFPLAPGAGRYRLEYSTNVDDPDFRYGTAVRTVWDFTATAAPTVNEPQPPYQRSNIRDQNPAAWQPVIFLSYEIPLALDNTAPAGLPIWFTVRASEGRPGSAKDIVELAVEASFDDGATWARPWLVVPVGNGEFRVLLNHPRLDHTTGAVTLRVKARDRAGNSVSQTVSRAYGLTNHSHRPLTRPAV